MPPAGVFFAKMKGSGVIWGEVEAVEIGLNGVNSCAVLGARIVRQVPRLVSPPGRV